MVHSALKSCVIVTVGLHEDWNNQKVKDWVSQASGKVESRVTEATTHLVVSKKEWEKKGVVVQDALKRKDDSLQEIEIVSYDWLADSLHAKSKKREKGYRFVLARSKGKGGDEPRSNSGLMKQLFDDHTLGPTPAEKGLIEKRAVENAELARKRDEAKMKDFEQSRMTVSEYAAIFKRGAQKARTHLLNENHHIYQDCTGFCYDVTLTKVDAKHNTNERYSLVIFESNNVPNTYALCASFSGTRLQQTNHTIVAIGSPWPTVYRAFTQAFFEKTGVKWTDRVIAATERQQNERKRRIRGYAAEMVGGPQAAKRVEDFDQTKFQYTPPAYGPKGEGAEMPKAKDAPVDLTGEDDDSGTRSASPAHKPEFGPEEVEKFKQAVMDGEIDPYEAPFSFGKDGFVAAEDDTTAAATIGDDLDLELPDIPADFDFDAFEMQHDTEAAGLDQHDTETAATSSEFISRQERSRASQSLGKRRDFPTASTADESEKQEPAEKKQKTGLEEDLPDKGPETQFRKAVDAMAAEQEALHEAEGDDDASG
ncbi:uncharacterized protein MYCFIDRAFT_75515 [Pseudocercospora fijiensis CIRAD86]|uniref:Uncharacterized protein n=1 Tax=Pseudocercospora fijiensis (strain CIRAD86) TaxID=383855 RepID=N1Q646_PSEFD|nr:uncharacterized protein MYCFIDRAFT_75515 [Pseudocercospora fijiensis CIRAD86]EME87670.1 hypothetical protein MYCFIDRAFT_75515 [Pseudocercospora fijiensis CIRAD86]